MYHYCWVEPGGPNSNDMNGIMYNLQGVNVIGADICEVNGLHIDFSSAAVAAKATTEMACLMAIARGKAEPRIEFGLGWLSSLEPVMLPCLRKPTRRLKF